MKRPKVRNVLLVACVVVVVGVVVDDESTPMTSPIFLESSGSPGFEASERSVCAAWLSISRAPTSQSKEWWIAVPRGSSLYSEIRSSKKLRFETDVGSGLSHVCIAEELPYQARPDLVNAVLAACKPKVSIGRFRVVPEDQVILFLREQYDAMSCERPVGTPTLVGEGDTHD